MTVGRIMPSIMGLGLVILAGLLYPFDQAVDNVILVCWGLGLVLTVLIKQPIFSILAGSFCGLVGLFLFAAALQSGKV